MLVSDCGIFIIHDHFVFCIKILNSYYVTINDFDCLENQFIF